MDIENPRKLEVMALSAWSGTASAETVCTLIEYSDPPRKPSALHANPLPPEP